MKLYKGSVLTLSNGMQITLEKDTEISFPNSQSESTQVGFLNVTNNYHPTQVQSQNGWRANSEQFKYKRDPNGNLLSLEEQVVDGQTVDDFILKLPVKDTELFGVTDRQAELKAAAAEAKKGKK